MLDKWYSETRKKKSYHAFKLWLHVRTLNSDKAETKFPLLSVKSQRNTVKPGLWFSAKNEEEMKVTAATLLGSSTSSPCTPAHHVNSRVWSLTSCIHSVIHRHRSVTDSCSDLKRPLFLCWVAVFDMCWSTKRSLTILLRQLHWSDWSDSHEQLIELLGIFFVAAAIRSHAEVMK